MKLQFESPEPKFKPYANRLRSISITGCLSGGQLSSGNQVSVRGSLNWVPGVCSLRD